MIHEKGQLLPQGWQARQPDHSAPYTSTIVFVVHKGNPKAIRDWEDLLREGVAVITPNPKTSGGARGATTTFAERGLGDVLIAWENEAFLLTEEVGKDRFEIIVPSMSILAEPPVALVDRNVDRKGTRAAAEAWLRYLYSEEGQELAAKHHFRPRSRTVAAKYASRFPAVSLFTLDEVSGGWKQAQKKHFDDGGAFDQLYVPQANQAGATHTMTWASSRATTSTRTCAWPRCSSATSPSEPRLRRG